MVEYYCQIRCLQQRSAPIGTGEALWRRRNRLRRILKRRRHYLNNLFLNSPDVNHSISDNKVKYPPFHRLQPGDKVRVRSKVEIQATPNYRNQLKGCSFMEEMRPYYNTKQRLLKRIEKFLDERDYLMKKTRAVNILDAVFCGGTKDSRVCDRTFFYFRHDEWLEKVN